MLIIRGLVSRATSSVSIQDPDRNIHRSVKLLTETDIQGQPVREKELNNGERQGNKENAGFVYQIQNGNLKENSKHTLISMVN